MKKWTVLFLSLLLSGCVYTEVEVAPNDSFFLKNQKNLTKIQLVKTGMTYQEVGAIMETHLKTGYQKSNEVTGAYEIMAMKNPQRTETLKGKDGIYTVAYYYTHVKNADGLVADDELTPLVFFDNKLISKGWDALYKLKNSL